MMGSRSLRLSRALACGFVSLAAIAAIIGEAPARAQSTGRTPPETTSKLPPDEASVADIIVTGSRLSRSTFTAPNPVTVIGAAEIQKLGLTNVGAILAQLPQNSNFFAGNNVGLGNFNVGAQLANLRGLNPFFGTRTLTLVDTRRVVPNTTGGAVDITLIPSVLVGRSETVTGGASAVYGSDAVAGVVNIILDTKLEGFKGILDYGGTTHGDGAAYHGGAAYGFGFAEGRGHVVIGGEAERSDSIGICSQARDWCSQNQGMYTNPNYATPGAPGYGQPHFLIGANAKLGNQTTTGVLAPCAVYAGVCITGPFPQLKFNDAGNAVSVFDPGKYAAGAGFFGFRQGGDGSGVGAYDTTTMRPQVTRYTGLAHLDYVFSSAFKVFLEGSLARSEAVNPVANGAIGPYSLEVASGVFVGSHIATDNAFLPAAVAAALPAGGADFGRNLSNIVTARNETDNTVWRMTGGFSGNLAPKWTYDAYGTYGSDRNNQKLFHSVVNGSGSGYDFLNWALDAVRDPSGKIVCGALIPGRINPVTGTSYTADARARATATSCTPLNLFGANNASPQAIDYAFRTLKESYTYTQQVVSGNIRGELFGGFGAGPVQAAFGAEYRREHGNVTHDLANQPWYDQYFLSYGLDYAGTIQSTEGYAEINLPLLKDVPAFHYLEFDGAIRGIRNKNTDHTRTLDQGAVNPNFGTSRTHDILSWKVSGIWDLTDWLRLRATRSRDVRAAGFRELFQTYASSGAFGSVTNPFNNGLTDAANVSTGGDINLKPEKADTTTFGIVFAPKGNSALAGLRLSADWYSIDLKGAIAGPPFGLGAQNIVAQCYQGVQAFCDRITFADASRKDIIAIQNTSANLGAFRTRGVDFEGEYRLPLNRLRSGWNGNFSLRVIVSYLYDMTIDAGLGAAPVNYAGQSGPTGAFGGFNTQPKWQGNAFLTYANGPFTGTVQLRYVGPGKFLTVDAAGNLVREGDPTYEGSIDNNHVASALYVNLSGSLDITKNVAFFATMNNVFDKDPAIAPGGNGYPTNPVYFDTYGRAYKIGLRVKY
jgi:outer membrane receptor protein involved in Fe transport